MIRSAGCADPAAPCHLLRRQRVTVTLDEEHSDAALRRTQEVIHGLIRVSGLPQLGRVLVSLRGCPLLPESRTLDLLAHSSGEGILRFGSSQLAPGDPEVAAFGSEHRDDLQALGFARVRLLGCYTVLGARAQESLQFLHERLGLPVYGCVDTVGRTLFDVDGLSPKWDSLFTTGRASRGHDAAKADVE